MTATENNSSIYLDNSATTFPKPEEVWKVMDEFARSGGANANRGQNPLARRAARLIEETRGKVADWLDLPHSGYITFAPSATIALNQVILGTYLDPGQAVYVSPFEHNSILRPVTFLKQTKGAEVQEIPFHPSRLEVDWDKLELMWRNLPPTVLALSQASNVCGLLLPLEKLAELARSVNPEVIVIVDGAQAAGLYPLNLKSGLFDYLVWSGHKSFYGPFGAAGIALCTDKRPQPIFFGGTGTISESLQMPENLPAAFEPGSINSPAIAGLNAAIDWLKRTGRDAVVNQTANLLKQLESDLAQLPGIRIIKVPENKRVSVLSITMKGIAPQALEEYLGNKGIAVRAGLHCAPWTHRFLDTLAQGGTVRFSPGFFNSSNDIQSVKETFEHLLD